MAMVLFLDCVFCNDVNWLASCDCKGGLSLLCVL